MSISSAGEGVPAKKPRIEAEGNPVKRPNSVAADNPAKKPRLEATALKMQGVKRDGLIKEANQWVTNQLNKVDQIG